MGHLSKGDIKGKGNFNIKTNVNGSGQECPLYTQRGRPYALFWRAG